MSETTGPQSPILDLKNTGVHSLWPHASPVERAPRPQLLSYPPTDDNVLGPGITAITTDNTPGLIGFVGQRN